jgi:SAM-dependent methyltransferase
VRLTCPICKTDADHRLVEICNGFRLHHCRECDVVFSDPMVDAVVGRRTRAEQPHPGQDLSHLAPGARFFLRSRPNPGGLLLDASGDHGCVPERALNEYDVFRLSAGGTPLPSRRRPCTFPDDQAVPAGCSEHACDCPSFDVVTLFDTIARVGDPGNTLRSLRCLLRPGGMLVITVPNRARDGAGHDPLDKPPERLSRWTSGAAVSLLRRNGFGIVRVHEWRRGWYGFFESQWSALTRACVLSAPLIRRLQRRRTAFYKNNPLCIYDETKASALAGYLLIILSMILGGVIHMFYLIRRRPALTLYIEARVET